jgi:hypothetical protein
MPSQIAPIRHRRPASRQRVAALLLAGAVMFSVTVAACFGDDDEAGTPAPASGSIVTVPAASATATTQPLPAAGGTLAPAAPSPAAAPTTAAIAPAQVSSDVASMLDMAPCAGQAYYEVQTFDGGIPALTYKDVPVGTPIVFPFEEGRLRAVDAREDAIVLVYDVEGVGTFTVQASGPNSLDRLVGHPVAGTVIGHFAGPFEAEATHAFEDSQLFAVASTDNVIIVDGRRYVGEALNLAVEDCVVLP